MIKELTDKGSQMVGLSLGCYFIDLRELSYTLELEEVQTQDGSSTFVAFIGADSEKDLKVLSGLVRILSRE